MKNVVVGTAGHIDHGKTLLVKSLTGIDADRLREEKARGITIDIGFAALREAQTLVHFVDLPGHEKFIRNMLAGATGIDFFLLVVAADESVMPQTVEHLDILRHLGITRGVVALNKIDRADAETADLAMLEIDSLLEKNGFRDIEVIRVSAKTGEGVPVLRDAILREAAAVGERSLSRPFRLPVDRIFSIKGFGTVVTGTSTSGTLRTGETLTFYPSLRKSKVRGIEVFREKKESASGGERVALNVPEVFPDEMARGEIAAASDSMFPAKFFYCAVDLPTQAFKSASEFQMHISTMEVPVRIAFPADARKDGEPLIVQVRSKDDLAVWPGDRFILRLPSPLRTVGGGTVLLPTLKRAKWHGERTRRVVGFLGSPGESSALLALLADNGERGASRKEAAQRLGVTGTRAGELMRPPAAEGKLTALSENEWWIDPAEFGSLAARALNYIKRRHEGPPVRPHLRKEEFFSHFGRMLSEKRTEALLSYLTQRGEVVVEKDKMRMASFEPPVSGEEEERIRRIFSSLEASFPAPLSREEILEAAGAKDSWLLDLLRGGGRIVAIDGGNFFFSREGFEGILASLREFEKSGHRVFKVPEFKNFLGLTRKTVIPLLEHLDRTGYTKRDGDLREILPKGASDEAE